MPVPGKHHDADRQTSSMALLRLNGAALACLAQSGLNATCVTLRLSAQQAAIRSAPDGGTAVQQHHIRMFGRDAVQCRPEASVSLQSLPPVNATLGPVGSMTWVSARRRAAMKSRLSTMAAVKRASVHKGLPWRGCQAEPVWVR